MLYLHKNDLTGLLPPLEVIAAVEAALRAHAAGKVVVPKRLHLHWNDNTLLTMPAVAESASGVKIVSVAPGNAARGIPVTTGIMILNDTAIGVPLAIMDAAALTAQRTGAVGALGLKYLTPPDISTVGIVGCGVQGTWQAISACTVRPIREIFVVNRSRAVLERFMATVHHHVPNVRITPCQDARDLLERTQVVIAATSSSEPVLPDEPRLLEKKHFISVGSFKPSMQELPDSVYRLAGQLFVDSEHARVEVGDVINALKKRLLDESEVFSIADCVTGQRNVDTTRTTAYKSVGAAMYDLFVAQAFYFAARSQDRGRELEP